MASPFTRNTTSDRTIVLWREGNTSRFQKGYLTRMPAIPESRSLNIRVRPALE